MSATKEKQFHRALNREILADAWFIYTVTTWMAQLGCAVSASARNADQLCEAHAEQLNEHFTEKWGQHKCGVPGCGSCMVLDGHFKCKRALCAADDGSVTSDELKSVVFTGCTETPEARKLFCTRHQGMAAKRTPQDPPSLSHGMTLRPRAPEPSTGRVSEGMYIIETIVDMKRTGRNKKYRVRWLGWPPEFDTWETHSSLTSEEGGRVAVAEWEVQRACRVVPQATAGPLKVTQDDCASSSCNTFKQDQRKPSRFHTAGVAAAMWPCGIIVGFTELFRSESCSLMTLFLLKITSIIRKVPSLFVYDDACHMWPFLLRRKDLSPAVAALAGEWWVVDKLHIANHTGDWCLKHCHPDKHACLTEKPGVNTEVCEQTFSWLAGYKTRCRHMSKHRFHVYLLRMCDLHNEESVKIASLSIKRH